MALRRGGKVGVGGVLYRYNGKELNQDLGLYDYGARNYDPVIGRWLQIDPLAETMPGWSGYNYVYNNPISLIDPLGLSPYKYNWKTGASENDNGLGDGIIDRVVSTAKSYASTLARNFIKSVGARAQIIIDDVVDNVTVEARVEETLSVGAQAGVEIDKQVDIVGNLASVQLLKGTIGIKANTANGVQNSSKISALGVSAEDGSIEYGTATVRSNFDASLGDGAMGAGFSTSSETDVKLQDGGLSTTKHVVEQDIGATTGPVANWTVGGGVNTTTGQKYLKASVGAGVEGSAVLGIKFDARIEIRYNIDR